MAMRTPLIGNLEGTARESWPFGPHHHRQWRPRSVQRGGLLERAIATRCEREDLDAVRPEHRDRIGPPVGDGEGHDERRAARHAHGLAVKRIATPGPQHDRLDTEGARRPEQPADVVGVRHPSSTRRRAPRCQDIVNRTLRRPASRRQGTPRWMLKPVSGSISATGTT